MPILAPLQGWRQVLASVTHFRRSAVPGSRSTGPELEPISQNGLLGGFRASASSRDPARFARPRSGGARAHGSEPNLLERLQDGAPTARARRCAQDLAKALVAEGSQEWRDYCRNAGTLRMLNAVQASGSDHDADARRVVEQEALHRE